MILYSVQCCYAMHWTDNESIPFYYSYGTCACSISGSRQSVAMDYMPYMRHLITAPLVREGSSGVDQTVSLLHAYDLLREDFDNILEVSSWSSTQDIMSHIDSKVSGCYFT